jgi:1-acyl-sn-glycerol-3-phosphate acyltransferase
MGPIDRALDSMLVHFFPEGRLYKNNQRIRRFKQGVFFLALALESPVIPLTTILLPRRFADRPIAWLPPRVKVIIDKPVYPQPFREDSENRKEAASKMARYTRELMQRNIDRHRNGNTR